MDYSEVYCIAHALRDLGYRALALADELNKQLARQESDEAQDIDSTKEGDIDADN